MNKTSILPGFSKSIVALAMAGICGGLAWSAAIFATDTVTSGKFNWQPADLLYPVAICLIATTLAGSVITLVMRARPINLMRRVTQLRTGSAATGLAIAGIVMALSPGAILTGIFSGAIVATVHYRLCIRAIAAD